MGNKKMPAAIAILTRLPCWPRPGHLRLPFQPATNSASVKPEIIEETIDDGDEDGGEGKGNPERTAEEVIRSAKKSGGVWLYRNLVKRDSLKPDENAFLVALRAALVGYGISTTELDK